MVSDGDWSTMTESEANDYCLEHQNTAPVEVYIKCLNCKKTDSFSDCSLRYGPTGSIHEHLDTCYQCDTENKDFETTQITCNGLEVIF